jgi:hypothetical protein
MRIAIGIVLVLALAAGVAGVVTHAYNLGVAQGLAQSGKVPVPGPGVGPFPVYPYSPYGYPYGYYPFHGPFGFGFFGFLGPILFVFLVFALLRVLFWRGHGWGGHSARGVPQRFEEWHRRAHESQGQTGTV